MLRRSSSIVSALAAALVCFFAVGAEAQTTLPINITSTPPGATVFVDTTTGAAIGVTPLRRVRVARGNHNLIFRLEGYRETTVPVSITRYGQTIPNVNMVQLARLQITAADASAQGATVTIDGERRGTIPYSDYIQPDRVQIVITRDGYVPGDQWVTLTPGQVFAWPVTLQRNAPRTGSLAVFADLRGAPVFIDGTQRCQTPCTISEIDEGPHLVEIRPAQEGARPHTQQVTVVAGQMATVDATIEVAPQTGTLRVLSTTPGAVITVDGEPVGPSPATRAALTPGEHIVEVSAPGFQRAQQTVTITAGQSRVISVDLSAVAATSGTLRVIGTPRGAVVTVDGEPIGELPAERQGISAGDHVVEVALPGYVTSTQTVTVIAGQQRIVSVTLAEAPRAPGRIVIRANVAGATVLIDGSGPYAVPYALDSAPVGTHAIIVRAQGYAEFSQTCEVGPGRDCAIDATLEGARVPLRVQVQTDVANAQLFLDGTQIGTVPYNGQIGVGQHRLEIRADGYRVHAETLQIGDNEPPRVLDVRLRRTNELTPEEIAEREAERERAMRLAFTRTGANLPADLANVELLAGWPYLAEVRLNMGIHEHADLGLTFRNSGRLTEFMVRGRAGWRIVPRFSVGGQVMIGGGIGPTRNVDLDDDGDKDENKTNSFVINADALATLHLTRIAAFTFNFGFDLTSDRWNFEHADRDLVVGEDPVSNPFPGAPGRQTTTHLRLGATLEMALSNHDSLMIIAQGVFGPRRRILGDMFGAGASYEGTNIGDHMILQVGWTHKFNWRMDEDDL